MDLDTVGLQGASFAVSSFVASSHPLESCGLNGLPLTPHSTAIQGAAQLLLTCRHKHLARYLDVQRGKHQRIIVVQESWPRNLSNIEKELVEGEEELLSLAKQILQALAYLNQMSITNLNLVRENVMLGADGQVRLFNYGLGRMTNYGSWVSFPCLTDPRATAPEVVARGLNQAEVISNPTPSESPAGDPQTMIPPESPPPYGPSSDTWSLGLLLASLALDIPVFWPGVRVGQVLRKVVSLQHCETGAAVIERLSREHGCVGRVATIPQTVLDLITTCLTPNPEARPTPQQLLLSDLVGGQLDLYTPPIFPSPALRCALLPCPLGGPTPLEPLERLTVAEIYYLWQLAGGDVQSELARQGLLIASPPCLSLPSLCTTEGQMFGQPKPRHTLYSRTLITLTVSQLEKSLSSLRIEELAPLIDSLERTECPTRSLPLVIREKDVKYQCVRTILYRRLLQAFPHRRKNIWSEALVDVVPMYRSYIWASLLNIPSNLNTAYAALDKESWNPVDRQIEVDIPRCHQYSELLASPEGHRKLKRVLKAWVADNPSLVYWQGLDSLAAPFIFLNFNDEALAWACLSAFIPKYLHNMFMKDNAVVIQEYLAKFSHLQAFHDPDLFNHLDEIGFIPDLYAIPWVLTMFSHVFPLHKIFHLWDRLLLGNSSFPLCVGLAVLLQLRAQLMEAQFNECILLFSDMPAVDIDNVVSTSMEVFTSTPASLTWREHDSGERKTGPLHISPLPVKTLKEEKVGRISGADLISLLDTGKLLAVDTRPVEDWKMGSLSHSVSIPASSAFTPTGELAVGEKEVEEAKKKGLVVAVVGTAKDKSPELLVAEGLVRLGVGRVATLHGGIEVFRGTANLVLPNV